MAIENGGGWHAYAILEQSKLGKVQFIAITL